jgi:hypothetical protein
MKRACQSAFGVPSVPRDAAIDENATPPNRGPSAIVSVLIHSAVTMGIAVTVVELMITAIGTVAPAVSTNAAYQSNADLIAATEAKAESITAQSAAVARQAETVNRQAHAVPARRPLVAGDRDVADVRDESRPRNAIRRNVAR